jgi:hypothetical protein
LSPSSGKFRVRNYEVARNVWPAMYTLVWDGIFKIDCYGKSFLGFNSMVVERGRGGLVEQTCDAGEVLVI